MTAMHSLVHELHELCDARPWVTTWYLKDLATGEAAHRDGHLTVVSASVRKVATMMTLFQKVHEDRFSLDQEVTSYQSDLLGGGTLKELDPPFTLTLEDLVVLMIIISDNCASSQCVDMVSFERINAFCRSIGMTNTVHRRKGDGPTFFAQPWWSLDLDNQTTAADQGLLLQRIVEGADDERAASALGVSSALCRKALDIMCRQLQTSRIPYHMPKDTRVASKGGTGAYDYSDIAVIFDGNRPRLVWAVFTSQVPPTIDGLPSNAIASDFIARLSRRIIDRRLRSDWRREW